MKEIRIPVSEIETINILNKTEVEVILKNETVCKLEVLDISQIERLKEMIESKEIDELGLGPLMY